MLEESKGKSPHEITDNEKSDNSQVRRLGGLMCGRFRSKKGPEMAHKRIPERFQVWIEARQRYHLSHAQVQMARELGMNPKSLGKLDNHRQEPSKLPLPRFI